MWNNKRDFLDEHPELEKKLCHVPDCEQLRWDDPARKFLMIRLALQCETTIAHEELDAYASEDLEAIARRQVIEMHDAVMKMAIELGVELPCGSVMHTRPMP